MTMSEERGAEDMGAEVFRQEAADLIRAIERGLMDLERDPANSELVNAVFRDLHTVKGSGAMFGFAQMAHFVHDFETAFDLLRQGEAQVSPALIEVSLAACDQIQRLMADPEAAMAGSTAILARLSRALVQDMATQDGTANAHPRGWRLRFQLAPDALRLGHNPLLLLDELRDLGPCRIRALTGAIPPLAALDPADCLMGWEVEIEGEVSEDAINSVFMFHTGHMQLDLAPLGQPADARGTPKPREAGGSPDAAPATPAAGDTMRVATARLDELMDRVGELVIAEARLQAMARRSRDPALLAVAEDIQRLSSGLRDSTMSMRMVPIGSILGRFRRLMRDLSASLGKPLDFRTSGEETELDKTVIELLADPLVHILRNSADHGLEPAGARLAAGKPETGTVELMAAYSGAEVLITVRDDGRGLDATRIRRRATEAGLIAPDQQMQDGELYRLIFEPGFSTAEAVTELSGRGVGMDVVKRTIAALRGQIDLTSEPGHGTTVTLRLPLTLAIIDGLLVEVGGEHYTIPLAAVEECVELPAQHAAGSSTSSFLNIRDRLVPFIRLRGLFDVAAPACEFQKVVVVTASGGRVGLVVDRIVSNTQTVIKQLSPLHAGLRGFAGATIMGDGSVALILDIPQLVSLGRALEDRNRKDRAA